MPSDFKNLTILVVEDDPTMKLLFSNIFERLGFRACFATESPVEALDIYHVNSPDIVITDYHMKDMNGVELVKRLRAHDRKMRRLTPIILTSGLASDALSKAALNAGVTEFLLKPFALNDLVKMLHYVLRKPRARVSIADYYGPERRRLSHVKYKGPERRKKP